MRLLRVLRQRARSLFRGARVDADLANELALHLEQLTRENMASGMDPAAARLAARRAMGGVAQIAEQCRDQRRIAWLTDLRKDAAFAWRMLRKSPGFTVLALATLGLGVGACIAVYALAESLLLRSLPYPSPERLVAIFSVHARRGEMESVGQADFRDWQAANTVFSGMAFTEFSQATLTGTGDPERITGRSVSDGFFEMLAVPPLLGRWFTREEQKPGAARVVMLSYRFWKQRLGGRPDVAGTTLYYGDRPYRVAGVMPPSFRFNEGDIAEYWTPITYRNYGHQNHQYQAYARLKPGVTLQAAQSQMSAIARRMEKQYPDCAGWGIRVRSMRGAFLDGLTPALLIFAAAALIMLLVACGNVASLLLARGLGRSKEIAVRLAMGAGRGRIARLLLTESLLLSGLGALAGAAVARWLIRLAIAAAPPWLELESMVKVSPFVVAFSIALVLATGLVTGLWPAIQASRADLQSDLKESGNSVGAGRRQARALHGLVVVEIALAVVLLTFAGLLAKSMSYLLHTDLGYRADHLLTFRLPLPSSHYRDAPARQMFWDKLLPQLAALPGIVSAAASDSIPLGGTYGGTPVEIEGRPRPRDWTDATTRYASVTPQYFATMGIPLRGGRAFDTRDTATAEPVLIVNEAFARKLLPGQNPIGVRVRLGQEKWQRVVGVIADSRYQGPAESYEPEAYGPYTQDPYLLFVLLRTAVPEASLVHGVRNVIRATDSALPITQLRTMQESVDLATTLPREMMTLVSGFAAVTLGMAILGLGGVMAYTVSRRKREIGLRMALGAARSDVSRAVLAGAARMVLAGAALGILGALAAARVLQSLLFGVRPHDPFVVLGAPVLLCAVALLACLAPAHQAASVDPMDALRQE